MPADPYIFSFGHVGEDAAADPFADPVGGSNGRKLPVNRKTYKGAAGKAYDCKIDLEAVGVDFKDDDIALFYEDYSILAVVAAEGEVDLVEAFIESILWDTESNIELKVSLYDVLNGAPKRLCEFSFQGRSGQRSKIEYKKSDEEKFSCELDPVIGADGQTIDFACSVEGTRLGVDYATTTISTIRKGNPFVLKVDLEGDQPISLEVKVEGDVVPVNRLSVEVLEPDNEIGEAIRRQVMALVGGK